MTNIKALFTFAGIYLFLFIFNHLHPLNFGDDYIYSFIWQGNSMLDPLTEDAVRVSSFKDLFVSQWSLYFTWGGRTVGQMLTQFFLWTGKGVFDIFNALIGTLLVAEIYWCIHKGDISHNFKAGTLFWIFFLLWSFTPGFSSVFLWLTAACIYLWTHTILLAFLIPYIQQYYQAKEKHGFTLLFKAGMFFGGIIAGWTNENNICWIVLLLVIFTYKSWKNGEYESWMGLGLSGLFIGYALLMLAPGNVVRLKATYGEGWFNLDKLKENLTMLFVILTYQLILWYFNVRSLYSLKKKCINDYRASRDILLVKVIGLIAFCSLVIMLFSPYFPARSGFFGTILLIIAAGILLRIQKEFDIELIQSGAKTFLFCIGAAYFVMTVTVSLHNFYKINLQMQDIIASAQRIKNEKSEDILIVDAFKETSKLQDMMSGFHVPDYELSEDEKDWKNVDFSRYYKIKGIRMVKEKDKE